MRSGGGHVRRAVPDGEGRFFRCTQRAVKTKPKNFLTCPAGQEIPQGRARPGWGHEGGCPQERHPRGLARPCTRAQGRTNEGPGGCPAPPRARSRSLGLAAPSPPAPTGPARHSGRCWTGRTGPAAPVSLLPAAPAHTARPAPSARGCLSSPPSLPPPPPHRSLGEGLTCPPPKEAPGEGSRRRAASPAPPRLPASRDAGVLPCSGQQPLPEMVPT